MTDRAINTERNYSAGTENLRKSGHAICECRHQVSYVGNTIMQGKDSESQINVEKIFFPIWLQPQVWSNSSLPWLRSHQAPQFCHPFPQTLNSNWPGTISVLVNQSRTQVQPKGQVGL